MNQTEQLICAFIGSFFGALIAYGIVALIKNPINLPGIPQTMNGTIALGAMIVAALMIFIVFLGYIFCKNRIEKQ